MEQFDWITFDRIETNLLQFFSARYPFDRRSIIRNLICHWHLLSLRLFHLLFSIFFNLLCWFQAEHTWNYFWILFHSHSNILIHFTISTPLIEFSQYHINLAINSYIWFDLVAGSIADWVILLGDDYDSMISITICRVIWQDSFRLHSSKWIDLLSVNLIDLKLLDLKARH